MLYRIHQKLLIDHNDGAFIEGGNGCVHSLSMLSARTRQALLDTGAISEVQAPPLTVFWGEGTSRTRKLADLGIDTVGFVTMGAKDVAYAIRASVRKEDEDQETFNRKADKLALAVERWQAEIRDYLGIGSAEIKR